MKWLTFELDTAPGLGQVDAGAKAGRYLELGAAPGWAADKVGIAFPVKVGLSLRNYHELADVDHRSGISASAASSPCHSVGHRASVAGTSVVVSSSSRLATRRRRSTAGTGRGWSDRSGSASGRGGRIASGEASA